jgi:hypothetical protein
MQVGKMVPAAGGVDPVGLPAGQVGIDVVLDDQDGIAAKTGEREQPAVLVARDAAILAADDPHLTLPAPLDGAVVTAVLGDDKLMRRLGEAIKALHQSLEAIAAAVGDDGNAETHRGISAQPRCSKFGQRAVSISGKLSINVVTSAA